MIRAIVLRVDGPENLEQKDGEKAEEKTEKEKEAPKVKEESGENEQQCCPVLARFLSGKTGKAER